MLTFKLNFGSFRYTFMSEVPKALQSKHWHYEKLLALLTLFVVFSASNAPLLLASSIEQAMFSYIFEAFIHGHLLRRCQSPLG